MAVLIVEDHQMFRDILVHVVRDQMGVAKVVACPDGASALEAFPGLNPDLVVLDLDLPDMDGFQVADQLLQKEPRQRIIAVSSRHDTYTLFRVLRSGLFGFIDKTAQSLDELRHGLEEAMAWRPYYATAVHQINLAQMADPNAFSKLLSPREQELLTLFGVGLNNVEIGRMKGLSVMTVQTHRRNCMAKLGLSGSIELIQYALKTGFTHVSDILRQSEAANSGAGSSSPASQH